MSGWIDRVRVDPLPALLAADDPALAWSVRVDLLGEAPDPAALWELPAAAGLLRRQRSDGAWRYTGRRATQRVQEDYDQLATYEALLVLVAKHRVDARHPALARAAGFLLGFQTEEGDLRGIYGTQYSPNYTAAILGILIEAGCTDDPRIDAGMRWLLSMRQDDGGWAIPHRTLRTPQTRSFARVMQLAEPLQPDRSRPFSHLVTGVVLRAFAAHPRYRALPETRAACGLLTTRFFRPDRYPDRRAASYWEKLRYPFRWTDIVSALDAITLVGARHEHPAIAGALAWLNDRQRPDGLWHSGYEKAHDPHIREWVSFAAARVFRRIHDGRS